MKLSRRRFLRFAVGGVALPATARIANAQVYPSRPITLVAPFAAGGPVDTLARFMAERLRSALGQPIIIENVSGAGGSLGVGRVARATPDGYTLVQGLWSTHVVNAFVYTLPYDVLDDFEPVALLTNNSTVMVARKTMPASDLKEFVAWLKANPDQVSVGTAGAGSPQHIFGVFLQNATGARFQFVHYRGSAPAMQDLVAGRIDLMINDQVTSLPQVRAGNIKAYAVMGKSRLTNAPDIPTADEAGLPGFHLSVWNALWAPKGTPKGIIARLNAAVADALADPAARAHLADLGQQVVAPDEQTPQWLRAFHKAELAKWGPIIKAANIAMQ
jgi:tripartite-type tricarboxylate transporter receptor subunit TctC